MDKENSVRIKYMQLFGVAVISVVVAIAVIYLTPVKNLNVTEPTTDKISPAEFYEQYQENPDEYLFVDVRQRHEYNSEHPEGAQNIPIQNLFVEHEFLPKSGKTIVLTCTGGSLSGVAYGFLEHMGFLNLKHLEGGLIQWNQEGLPTVGYNVGQ